MAQSVLLGYLADSFLSYDPDDSKPAAANSSYLTLDDDVTASQTNDITRNVYFLAGGMYV